MSSGDDQVPFDIARPSPARIYDYFLGGKDHFAVDRQAAERVIAAMGEAAGRAGAWENRRFLQRAVRLLVEAGIDQFIDLGTGLPTQGNVHEIAQEVNPDARVVYVDNDPIVLAHGRALLARNQSTTVITADIRDPDSILGHPRLNALIDFSRPVAVMLVAVLHFIRDADDPAGIVKRFRDVMAPGSYLTLTHASTDGLPLEDLTQIVKVYDKATSPAVFRSREQIKSLFDGTQLIEPGLVHPWQWQPQYGPVSPRTSMLYGGVGRIPSSV